MLKYELIKESDLYRIKALKSFGCVKKGDLGGLVERDFNLSQNGDCWIDYDSKVTGGIRVSENARIINSVLKGIGVIAGSIVITRSFFDTSKTELIGKGVVEDSQVLGGLWGSNFSSISKVYINHNAKLSITNMASVDGVITIKGIVSVSNSAHVNINQRVSLDTCRIIGDVKYPFDKITFIQTKRRLVTLYKRKGVYYCDIGCQSHMTLSDLEKRIKNDGGLSPHRMTYINIMKIAHLLL